ncbi:MAG: class I SAM-dependent methyltransferase [Anaerolineales bacterium]|nr:class I SAM-dependent methyltransferase [Anaerolineales bacterium]MCB9127935.1 class I SAM-dependent methyltransferase [Ardenticatenales bacterium]MCB9171697.1 class I SAM-dependent methyltransferase [Ardenticatenales bacterium]
MNEDTGRQSSAALWNEAAATFDNEADHGLRDPDVRAAWQALLLRWLPAAPCRVLDLGCGTGSLSVLLAAAGHAVTAVDVAEAMLDRARDKAKQWRVEVDFQRMDAATPRFAPSAFDVLLCRHLLWALDDPALVLQRWATLLTPHGRLLLIEGQWETGGGIPIAALRNMAPAPLVEIGAERLSDNPRFWGRAVADERYLIAFARLD